jgi:hypothetical protein
MSKSFRCTHCETTYESEATHLTNCVKTDSVTDTLNELLKIHYKKRVAAISHKIQKELENELTTLGKDLQEGLKKLVDDKDGECKKLVYDRDIKYKELEGKHSKLTDDNATLLTSLDDEKQLNNSYNGALQEFVEKCSGIVGEKRKRTEEQSDVVSASTPSAPAKKARID